MLNNQRHKRYYIIATILLTGLIVAISLWRIRPLSDEELRESDAIVEREDCYALVADGDTLLLFAGMEGESLVNGAVEKGDKLISGAVGKGDSVSSVVTRMQAQWVNRFPIIPSCRGRLMLMSAENDSLSKVNTEQIQGLVKRQRAFISQLITTLTEHKEHTSYYLRTHNVTELGYDVVAKETSRLASAIDSLHHVEALLAGIRKDANLSIAYEARYFAYVPTDSDTIRVECKAVDERKGMKIIRTLNGEKPANLSTRLSVYSAEAAREHLAKRPKAQRVLPHNCRIDSLGVYHGGMDSVQMAHGYGRLSSLDGSFYEGEWEHGKRNGFGMSLMAGKRMRIGEWKDDEYLGERITYTNERIYGIDISRYQHEKGRKRFKIDWSKLAIISLGTKSKKTIHGSVNYPISFIYIKSTEGKSVVNRYFFADYRAARSHGYKVGAYHFFSTKTSGASQALHFLKKSRYQKGDMPPVLDVEPSAAQIRQMGGVNAMFTHIRKWLSMVEAAWRVRPVLYISQTFVNKYLHSAPDIMKNYDVWIARYGEYKPEVNLVYWQLCPDGRVRGIQTEVDINVFNGFEAEWKDYI